MLDSSLYCGSANVFLFIYKIFQNYEWNFACLASYYFEIIVGSIYHNEIFFAYAGI
jgi:hypothetical protein